MAKADYNFDEAMANSWKDNVEKLNEETDKKLKEVGGCLAEIKNESEGSFVDQLMNITEQMVNGFANLISAFRKMVDLVEEIKNKFKQMAQSLLESATELLVGKMGIHN